MAVAVVEGVDLSREVSEGGEDSFVHHDEASGFFFCHMGLES